MLWAISHDPLQPALKVRSKYETVCKRISLRLLPHASLQPFPMTLYIGEEAALCTLKITPENRDHQSYLGRRISNMHTTLANRYITELLIFLARLGSFHQDWLEALLLTLASQVLPSVVGRLWIIVRCLWSEGTRRYTGLLRNGGRSLPRSVEPTSQLLWSRLMQLPNTFLSVSGKCFQTFLCIHSCEANIQNSSYSLNDSMFHILSLA